MFQGCEVCGWLCFYFVYVDWDLLPCGDPAAIVVFVNHSEVLKYCIIFLLLLSRILKKTTMYTSRMYIIILVRSVTSIQILTKVSLIFICLHFPVHFAVITPRIQCVTYRLWRTCIGCRTRDMHNYTKWKIRKKCPLFKLKWTIIVWVWILNLVRLDEIYHKALQDYLGFDHLLKLEKCFLIPILKLILYWG